MLLFHLLLAAATGLVAAGASLASGCSAWVALGCYGLSGSAGLLTGAMVMTWAIRPAGCRDG